MREAREEAGKASTRGGIIVVVFHSIEGSGVGAWGWWFGGISSCLRDALGGWFDESGMKREDGCGRSGEEAFGGGGGSWVG